MDWILEVNGEVANPLNLSLDDVRSQYPAYTTSTRLLRDNHPIDSTFTGARLWDILQTAGLNPNVSDHRRVIARAGDTFKCLLRWHEIDPTVSEHLILVAYEQNGQPLAAKDGPLRLIVSGDERGLRYLRGVASFTLLDKGRHE